MDQHLKSGNTADIMIRIEADNFKLNIYFDSIKGTLTSRTSVPKLRYSAGLFRR